VVGVRDHFEIWGRGIWQEYQAKLEAEGNKIPF